MSYTKSNKSNTTRIIPGPQSEHRIVSMPSWVWFWLDDFINNCSPNGYSGLYSAFGDAINQENLSDSLHRIAELHQDFCLREIYNLANDDEPDDEYIQNKLYEATVTNIKNNKKKNKTTQDRTPKIYKLFGFMPCPTTLDAVWARKHYRSDLLF